ncbi:MAG: cysteine desulfurase family protein [Minisyncoccota bacterium]
MNIKRVYFDHAASTPMDLKVVKAMAPYYSEIFGNPGSLHKFGQEASAAVFKARNKISKLINCDYREIIFTGSATEANSLALRGTLKALIQNLKIKDQNDNSKFKNFKPRIITSQIEHESILETCRDLEKEGVEVIYLPVSKAGIVDLKKLKESLNERTVLVSIMYANNEIGSIQPIKEISKIIYSFKEEKQSFLKTAQESGQGGRLGDRASRGISERTRWGERNGLKDECFSSDLYPLFHTDAVQAFNYLDCDIKNLGADLLTLSSQKIYGPKGVGLLYVRNFGSIEGKKFINPIITGGGQEEGLRSGTENVAGIVGMAEAVQLAFDLRKKESQRLYRLQDYFINQVKKIFPKVALNGPVIGEQRLPNNINIYFPGKKDLIFKLDFSGFAVSGGSACSARLAKPSHVLKALGCSDEKASESIRISFGRQIAKKEIDQLLIAIKKAL